MENKYHVIWNDDEYEKMSSFIKLCGRRGIVIEPSKTQKEGLKKLEENPSFWDAIILDVKSLDEDENETAKIGSLFKAVDRIKKDYDDLPYFIFTGQPDYVENEIFKQFCEETYSKRSYNKGSDDEQLCDDIIKAIKDRQTYKIKNEYSDIFSWLPRELTGEVLDLLTIVEHKENTNVDVFNKCRKVIDWIMRALNEYGILAIEFKGSNLAECSAFLGKSELQDYVPQYIQRSFHSCTAIANEGSHRLKTDENVRTGKAPFLVRSTVFELLNILMWYNQLPKDDTKNIVVDLAGNLKQENTASNKGKQEPQEPQFDVEFRVWHCGDIMLPLKDWSGGRVIMKDVIPNTSTSKGIKERYPYFAKFDPIDQK